ncbi:MAG: ankyrin repeat domain-containing protein [Vulcanimicrobiota bacterium]
MARSCPHCAAQNSDRAKFCTTCGSSMQAGKYPAPKKILIQSRYEVEYEIKRGGMGCVYKARDIRLNTVVAVKKMLAGTMSAEEQRDAEMRFKREAELLSRLHHGGLPKVIDYFRDADPEKPSHNAHFLVMTFIEGKDLDTVIAARNQKPFPADKVVDFARQILKILCYLHGQNPPVIYRDMNPRNIMVKEGRVFLVDFGIARIFTPQQKATNIGTPGYAPIEQCKGFAEPRSDLYSLGVVMHYLLTGIDPEDPNKPPFSFLPLRKANPSLPEYLEEIITVLLADRCSDRPASAEMLLQMLDDGPQKKTILMSHQAAGTVLQPPFRNAATMTMPQRQQVCGDIFEAIRKSDGTAVQAFIASGLDINGKNKSGNTPLHCAAGMGRKEIVAILLAAGAYVNSRDRHNETPLHKAASAGRKETSEVLIANAAEIDAQDIRGATPLHRAVARGALKSVELLLSSGAYVNAKDNDGCSPLHRAAEKDRKDLAMILVNHGALVNDPDSDGWTPLHLAAYNGHRGVTLLLRREGANADVKNRSGDTASELAIRRGYREIDEILSQQGTQSSSQTRPGKIKTQAPPPRAGKAKVKTPPPKAGKAKAQIHPQQPRISNAQTSSPGPGAAKAQVPPPQAKNAPLQAHSPRAIKINAPAAVLPAFQHHSSPANLTPEILKQIERAGKYSDIFDAAGNNDIDAMKGFAARGADLNIRSKGGMTLLHIAALRGSRMIAEFVISKGADVNSKAANGWTPLHCEAWIGRAEILELLISNGADINARDLMGKTPLKTAQEKGHRRIVELLKKHGAKGGGFLGLW